LKRLVEFILGLIGGSLFTLLSLVILAFTLFENTSSLNILPNTVLTGNSVVVSSVLIMLLFALLGLTGAFLVKKKATAAGIMMIISGIMGFAISGFPWSFLWTFPLIIAGMMACLPKTAKDKSMKERL